MRGTRQYRLFGILVWELRYDEETEDEVEDEVEEGDHQGGQFEFGFSSPPSGQLDPMPIQEPGW